MIIIRPYTPSDFENWNRFVADSKQGTFLLDRQYMDYHADRFKDHSLLFFNEKETLIAVLPANLKDGVLHSHQGLSYGGLLSTRDTRTTDILGCFEALLPYAKATGISKLVYKRIPYIYHTYLADEDLYALFKLNATLVRRDIGYVIDLKKPIPLSRNKKRYLKNFDPSEYKIYPSTDFEGFHAILEESLSLHNAKPIHSAAELKLLTERFKGSIFLYALHYKEEVCAFCWMFATQKVLHIQNMSASRYARENHFIDFVYNWVLDTFSKEFDYLSFGISTEHDGQVLNYGLADQKERFGARGVTHDFYELIFDIS